MKKRLLIILLFLTNTLFCFSNKEKEIDNNTNTNDKIIVGMELQYPPFEGVDENGEAYGISIDFAKELAKALNLELELKNIAWAGLIPSLQTGKIDLIISSLGITEDRKKVIDFSIPYAKSGLAILSNNQSEIKDEYDLSKEGIKIAVKSGTTGAIWASKLLNAEIMSFEDVGSAVLEILQNKADVFIYDPLTIYQNYLNNKDKLSASFKELSGTIGYWGIGIKKDREDNLLEKVNAFIKTFLQTKGFDALVEKYMKDVKEVFDKENASFFFDL